MNMREVSSSRRTQTKPLPARSSESPKRRAWPVLMTLVILAGLLSWVFLGISHAGTLGSPIKSGYSGYCLDDYLSKNTSGNRVDLWQCNNSSAQDWPVNL